MTDCSFEVRELLAWLFSPAMGWIVRQIMRRTSANKMDDYIDDMFAGTFFGLLINVLRLVGLIL